MQWYYRVSVACMLFAAVTGQMLCAATAAVAATDLAATIEANVIDAEFPTCNLTVRTDDTQGP